MLPIITLSLTLLASSLVLAYETTLGFNSAAVIETRTLDEIYQAALAEGGTVTLWHGGDETNQQDTMKQAFESRFPGMMLNLTVDLSKYHNGKLDQQLAANNVHVDSVILQTLHDYPRWTQEGALLHYAPKGFDQIHPAFRDTTAAWYGVYVFGWSFVWNMDKINVSLAEFADVLRPELKNKLVLTYPNDDDAVLYAFDLILGQYGNGWLDALLAQNPRWVRGTATPASILSQENTIWAATFTSITGLSPPHPLKATYPTGPFVTWPQTAAIPKDAPHPEGAKLLHNWILSEEFQGPRGWSVRQDVPDPEGFPLPSLMKMPGTNPTDFARWMADRAKVDRLRLWFESKLGTAQGSSPLVDDL
ncbi:ABC transporter [Podospora didyma]|uniref:ABC transporter n=1 Tax=Podospora didyma TaxID=330526 RepID=A0AAE0NU75_9PEZI|nr:ABC transporter [Podospora didyma]